ncbi:MAG: hypothetical protein ACKODK_12645 [Opitutaceae bacterium]
MGAEQVAAANPFTFGYVLNTPEGSSGNKQLSALVTLGSGETAVQITAKPDPLIVTQLTTHFADVDRNLPISLLELTRVIELYNTRTGQYRLANWHRGRLRPRILSRILRRCLGISHS